MNYWFFIVAAIAAVALTIAQHVLKKSKQKALARDRRPMSTDEIYRMWYESKHVGKDSFLELWHEVAECVRLPADLLRPQDQFGKDVGQSWITTDELDELYERAIRRANARGIEFDPAKIRTVDEYVLCFAGGTASQ